MKLPFQLVLLFFVLAILASACRGQSRPSKYDPAFQQRPSGQSNNFLDFTLGRINPENKDYGECLSEARLLLLHETIKSGYFWSNVIALGLLTCFFIVIIYQQRLLARREWSTAEVLTQFEQALTGCQSRLAEASRKNCELAEALGTALEVRAHAFPPPMAVADPGVVASPKTASSAPNPASTANPGPAKQQDGHQRNAAVQPANQMRLFSPDADLIMKVNSLEQQLAHSQKDNHALRRRIAGGGIRQASEEPNARPANRA
jgi:hypothetical protein